MRQHAAPRRLQWKQSRRYIKKYKTEGTSNDNYSFLASEERWLRLGRL